MKTLFRCGACAAAAIILTGGCAKSGAPVSGLTARQPASAFPVYSPSTVTAVGRYDDSLEVTRFGSSFFGSGATAAYPYVGTQELVRTSASLDALETWLKKLAQSPPVGFAAGQGLTDQDQGSADSATSAHASAKPNEPALSMINSLGLVPYTFWNKEHNHVVMLMLVDPKALAKPMEPTLALIDEWENMPAPLRSGIDEALKKSAGLSGSDLIDLNTPMGMVTYAVRNWRDEDARAIILVDATRQPNPLPTPHD